MALTIPLPAESEARLRRQAADAGTDAATYAALLLERALAAPPLDELLAPLRAEFAQSGATDEELLQQIVQARDAFRSEG